MTGPFKEPGTSEAFNGKPINVDLPLNHGGGDDGGPGGEPFVPSAKVFGGFGSRAHGVLGSGIG